MIRTNARVPKLGRHASGQAVVLPGGKDFYLGRFRTPEAQAQYDTLIAEWLSRGRTLPQALAAGSQVAEETRLERGAFDWPGLQPHDP